MTKTDQHITEETPTLRIGLFWHSPNSANLGVGALTVSNIEILRTVLAELGLGNGQYKFVIFCFKDARPPYVTDKDCEIYSLDGKAQLSPFSPLQQAINDCDLILDIGGGDSFTSIYGWKRIAYLFLSKYRVIKSKVPLILAPQTIGPFDNALSRIIAAWLLKRTHRVFARDEKSLSYYRDTLAPKTDNAVLTTDVAFALPYTKKAPQEDNSLLETAKPAFGINVSGLLYNGGYSGANEFGLTVDYKTLTDRMIELATEQGFEVHLVGHVLPGDRGVEDDYFISTELHARYPETVVAPEFQAPSEAKSYIAGLDVFAGARMHACIAAASSCVPVIPVAYSRKFDGLFGALDYHHTIDLKSVTTETALDAFRTALTNRHTLKQELEALNAKAQGRLDFYRSGVKDFLAAILNPQYND